MNKTGNIDEADDGHHDHRGQNRLGQMVKKRREEEQAITTVNW
jgi:hypothetical protein